MPKYHEEKLVFGLPREAGGVGAVGVVLDRVQRTLGGESPPGVCLEESGDELLVLLRLDAACAVNELAVRLGVCRRLAKQLELLVG